jgi:hypothetical protein
MAPSLSLKNSLILKVKQGIHAIGAFDVNIPSLSSIASAGPTLGDEFFSSKGKAAVPSASGNYPYFCAINKQRPDPVNPDFSVAYKRRQQFLPGAMVHTASARIAYFKKKGPQNGVPKTIELMIKHQASA